MIRPFGSRLVEPEWAVRVVSGAYDALSPSERRRLSEANPDSYFNVTRSPDDLLPGESVPLNDLLMRGRESLDRLLAQGAFQEADEPSLYVYRLETPEHSQIGVVGLVPVDGYRDGRILAHEAVRNERVDVLASHLEIVGAVSSPVALAVRRNEAVDVALDRIVEREPDLRSEPPAGDIVQSVWRVGGTEATDLAALFGDATLYVTDGHHRLAAAIEAADRAEQRLGSVPDELRWALGAVFPSDQLRILAFHRRLDGSLAGDAMARLAEVGKLHEPRDVAADDLESVRPTEPGEFAVYHGGQWSRFDLGDMSAGTALDRLDVARLQDEVLGPTFGVEADDPLLEYIADPVGLGELVNRCDADGGVAFVLRPTTISELMAVADEASLMPPKSSYFAPKPRSGLFLRLLGIGGHDEPSLLGDAP